VCVHFIVDLAVVAAIPTEELSGSRQRGQAQYRGKVGGMEEHENTALSAHAPTRAVTPHVAYDEGMLLTDERSSVDLTCDAAPARARQTDTPGSVIAVERPTLDRPQLARPARPAGRRFSAWSRRYARMLMALDALVGLIAVTVSVLAPDAFGFSAPKEAILIAAGALLWPVAVGTSRGYDRTRAGVGGDEMRAVLRAGGLAVIAGAFPAGLLNKVGLLGLVVVAVPVAAAASLAIRLVARKVLHATQRQGRNVRTVIVVGSAPAAKDLTTVLSEQTHCGMQVIGVCVPTADIAWAREAGLRVIGDINHIPGLVRQTGCDAVAVTGGDMHRNNYLRELAWSLETESVELLVHPGLVEVAGPRMHIRPHVGLPLLHIEQPHFTGWRRIIKRATDLTLTGFGLLVISPVLLGIAAAIRLTDHGPVFFRQKRVGLDGSVFTMWKFRSMHADAEQRLAELRAANPDIGVLFKMTDDPRITRIGKFLRKYSLDELPQLFNVLGGSMSLVGPRPPLQSEVDVYADDARRRLLVTPGLTGLWQVSGRSLLSWEETVRLDLRYVENWTLTFDLLILWKTVFAVIAKRGAY